MFGGRIGVMLLEEAKYCFVHGQYLATTMLAFALLEQTIAGHLHAAGDDDVEHASGAKLLSAAKDARLITSKEWALLNKLRKSRNPIVHFRKPLALDGLDGRSFAKKRHPWALAEQDARQLLRATVRLVARPLRPET